MNKKKKWGLVLVGIVVLCILVVAGIFLGKYIKERKLEQQMVEQLSLGNKYLEELDYEQAIMVYKAIIEIEPKNEEAILGLAEAYIQTEDYEQALEVLNKGNENIGSEAIKEVIVGMENLTREEYDEDGNLCEYNGLGILLKKTTEDEKNDDLNANTSIINTLSETEIQLLEYAFGSLSSCFFDADELCENFNSKETLESYMFYATMTGSNLCEINPFTDYCELLGIDIIDPGNSSRFTFPLDDYYRIMSFLSTDINAVSINNDEIANGNISLVAGYQGESPGMSNVSLLEADGNNIEVFVSCWNIGGCEGQGYYLGSFIAKLCKDDNSIYGYRLLDINKQVDDLNIIRVQASSTLENSDIYAAENIIDEDLSTAWVEGDELYGKNESIEIMFDKEYSIVGMLVNNGYMKNSSTFLNNNRIRNIGINIDKALEKDEFEDYVFQLEDWEKYGEESITQWMYMGDSFTSCSACYTDFVFFDQVVRTDCISLYISDVYEGELYDDTCISDVTFIGY